MDKYESLRKLPFEAIATALGVDLSLFKRRKGKHGPEIYGPCPICKPKHNVTAFSYSDSGLWNCFAGGHHGRGSIDFLKELRGCTFTDAVAFLQGITPANEKSPVKGNSEAVARPVDLSKYRKFAKPCEWLEKRIPDQAVLEKYGVFFYSNPSRQSAYSGRVMIPVKDMKGQLFGYLGRMPHTQTDKTHHNTDMPKYLFPKGLEKSKYLFGAYELQNPPVKVLYVVESPFCVMKFGSLGLPAVSPFGWSVSDEQIAILQTLAKGIVYLPDRNKYRECAEQVRRLSQVIWIRCPELPEGCDDPEQMGKSDILALTQS